MFYICFIYVYSETHFGDGLFPPVDRFVLIMFYCCFIVVLFMFYLCFIVVLFMFYSCFIDRQFKEAQINVNERTILLARDYRYQLRTNNRENLRPVFNGDIVTTLSPHHVGEERRIECVLSHIYQDSSFMVIVKNPVSFEYEVWRSHHIMFGDQIPCFVIDDLLKTRSQPMRIGSVVKIRMVDEFNDRYDIKPDSNDALSEFYLNNEYINDYGTINSGKICKIKYENGITRYHWRIQLISVGPKKDTVSVFAPWINVGNNATNLNGALMCQQVNVMKMDHLQNMWKQIRINNINPKNNNNINNDKKNANNNNNNNNNNINTNNSNLRIDQYDGTHHTGDSDNDNNNNNNNNNNDNNDNNDNNSNNDIAGNIENFGLIMNTLDTRMNNNTQQNTFSNINMNLNERIGDIEDSRKLNADGRRTRYGLFTVSGVNYDVRNTNVY